MTASVLRREIAAWIILGLVAHNAWTTRTISHQDAILLGVAAGVRIWNVQGRKKPQPSNPDSPTKTQA